MGVVAQREVAAAHVHAAQRVAVALLGVEVRAQQLVALCRAELEPGQRGRFGERAAEALDLLKAPRLIDPNARQAGIVRACRLERRLLAQPIG